MIECRPAEQVMTKVDSPDTLHYVDPPYMASTRTRGKVYRHEMTNDQHNELLKFLQGLEGSVVLSGYANELYDSALKDWRRIEIKTRADRASERTEVSMAKFRRPNAALCTALKAI